MTPHTTEYDASSEAVRKLVVIMFTDIKGFSKMMEANETKTLQLLEAHNAIMSNSVQQHGGTVIKTVGDAYLVTFESAVAAVTCAMEVQQSFLLSSKQGLEIGDVKVRIGIHLGDVVLKENDVFGDGVNIASRIQSLAQPGGINISGSVYDQVKKKLDLRVIYLGAPQLKNIKESVKIYQLIIIPEEHTKSKLATQLYVSLTLLKRKQTQRYLLGLLLVGILIYYFIIPSPLPPSNSIAVLPFENISAESNDYIADGVTDELIERLSEFASVKVTARHSVYFYRGKNYKEKDIAKDLGVGLLVTGNIRQEGNDIAVITRLVNPHEDVVIWSERYKMPKEELLQLQNQIVYQVAMRLNVEFEAKEQISFDAYDLYLRGLYELRKIKPESNILAITYFTQAVERDSRFARGYYALANAQLFNYERGWDRVERWLKESEQNCQKALSIDSTLSEAYGVLGRIATAKGELPRGISLLEQAIRLNPNDMHSLAALGIQYEYNLNDAMKAIDYFRRAMELSPNDHRNIHNMAYGYYMLKNYSEAKRLYRRVLELNPTFEPSWKDLGVTFLKLFEYDSASYAFRSVLEINPANDAVRDGLGSLYIMKKDTASENILLTGLKLAPSNYRLRYTLGLLYHKISKIQKAKDTWNTALKLIKNHNEQNPNLAEPLMYSGLCFARLGQQSEALNAARTAFKMDSTNSDIIWGIARIYSILRHKQEMLEWFKKAKSMSSEFDEALLKTEIDFEYYFNDEDLLAIARM